MKTEIDFSKVTRLEVVDKTGRIFVLYLREKDEITPSLQDEDRTLKIFINPSPKRK